MSRDNQKQWTEVFAQHYQGAPAQKIYCIAITARSGSTWLSDILSKSEALGDPKEYFNVEAARFTIKSSGSQDMGEYYQYLRSFRRTGDVFGFKASYFHIKKLIDEGYADVLDSIRYWFLLRRKDYVAQAVSLYRASKSGVFHSVQNKGEKIEDVPYDAAEIGRRVLATMAAEYNLTTFFAERNIQPVQLWYEELLDLAPEQMVAIFAEELEVSDLQASPQDVPQFDSAFEKLANSNSEMLISRFKDEHPTLIDYWDTHRGEKTMPDFMRRHPSYARFIRQPSDVSKAIPG